jgi:predicted phage tail protein
MSRRHHIVCLTAAAGLVLWVLLAGSGSLAVAGLSLALLVCPLVMGGVMWLLMRRPQPVPYRRATHELPPHT